MSSLRDVSALQLRDYIRQRELPALEQQRKMKEQVGGLADQLLGSLSHCRQCNLDAFLAHFLRHSCRAFRPQARGVASFRSCADALLDDGLELRQECVWGSGSA